MAALHPVIDGVKFCLGCEQHLPVSAFGVYGDRAGRAQEPKPRCKRCDSARQATDEGRARLRAARYVRKYGVTLEQVRAMLVAQSFACSICDDTISEQTMHVDHDHVTGAVRALLCGTCNRGLGQFKDDPSRLESAALYLRSHAARQSVGKG